MKSHPLQIVGCGGSVDRESELQSEDPELEPQRGPISFTPTLPVSTG